MPRPSADVDFFIVGEEPLEGAPVPSDVREDGVGAVAVGVEEGGGSPERVEEGDVLWADGEPFPVAAGPPKSSGRRGRRRGERKRDESALAQAPAADSHEAAGIASPAAGEGPPRAARRLAVGGAVAIPLLVGVAVVIAHLGGGGIATEGEGPASGIAYEPQRPAEGRAPRPEDRRRTPDVRPRRPTPDRTQLQRQGDGDRQAAASPTRDRHGSEAGEEAAVTEQPDAGAPAAPAPIPAAPEAPAPMSEPAPAEPAPAAPAPAEDSPSSDFSFGAG